MYRIVLLCFVQLAGLALLDGGLLAQDDRDFGPAVRIEWVKADFDEDRDLSIGTSVLFLTGRLPLSSRLRLVTEFPIAYAAHDSDRPVGSSTAFGNPMLGLESMTPGPLQWSLQLRAPVASSDEEATFVGLYSTFERLEAFQPDAVSAQARFHIGRELSHGLNFRMSGGPSFVTTADGRAWEEPESYIVYEPQLEYHYRNTSLSAQLSGRYLFTQRDRTFGQRTHHHLALLVSSRIQRWIPGLYVRVPFDRDLRELLDFVVGLTVEVHFY